MRKCEKCGKEDTEETAKDFTAFTSGPRGILCLECACQEPMHGFVRLGPPEAGPVFYGVDKQWGRPLNCADCGNTVQVNVYHPSKAGEVKRIDDLCLACFENRRAAQ